MTHKNLERLAVTACSIALCVVMTGCEAAKGVNHIENPVRTVYVYLPDGTLLDKGEPDQVLSGGYNATVYVTMNGKEYKTGWANVVLEEE